MALKISARSQKVDISRSTEAIIENYTLWQNTFREIEKVNVTISRTLIISNKWGIIDPYNGILSFYLSIAAIATDNNFNVILVCAGPKHETINISKSLKIISIPYKLNGLRSLLLNQTKKWNQILIEISTQYSNKILLGPNVGMEIYCNSGLEIPVITTLHTDWLLVPKKVSHLRRIRAKFLKTYYRYHSPTMWVSNTEQLLKDLENKNVFLNENKVKTVHHVPQATSLERKENFILFLGKQDSRKSPRILAETWDSISSLHPSWGLILVGPPGNETPKLLKYQKKNKSISVFGAVTPSEKNKIIAKSRIVVVPSIYESFGYATAEALEAGCHLIARGIPTLKEASNFQGSYFETKENLSQLLAEMTSKENPKKFVFDYQHYWDSWTSIFIESGAP